MHILHIFISCECSCFTVTEIYLYIYRNNLIKLALRSGAFDKMEQWSANHTAPVFIATFNTIEIDGKKCVPVWLWKWFISKKIKLIKSLENSKTTAKMNWNAANESTEQTNKKHHSCDCLSVEWIRFVVKSWNKWNSRFKYLSNHWIECCACFSNFNSLLYDDLHTSTPPFTYK